MALGLHGAEEPLPDGTLILSVRRARHAISGRALELLGRAAQESGVIPDEEEHLQGVRERFPEFRDYPPGTEGPDA